MRNYLHISKTSRERPKSAPYLRLKIAKGLQSVKYSLLQYPREEKIEKKSDFLKTFFRFIWSPVSRIVPKNVKGGPLGVFEHPFFCKIETNEGGPLGTLINFAKKTSKWQVFSSTVPAWGKNVKKSI